MLFPAKVRMAIPFLFSALGEVRNFCALFFSGGEKQCRIQNAKCRMNSVPVLFTHADPMASYEKNDTDI